MSWPIHQNVAVLVQHSASVPVGMPRPSSWPASLTLNLEASTRFRYRLVICLHPLGNLVLGQTFNLDPLSKLVLIPGDPPTLPLHVSTSPLLQNKE